MIEDNHNLIYSFCHKKGISIDEHYGLLAETMCRVVPKYNGDTQLSVFLYKCFNNALINHWKKNKDNNWCELKEYVKITNSMENDIILKDIMEKFSNDKIVNLYLQGYSCREIANKMNTTHSTVHRHITKFKLVVGELYGRD